jgi:hypothetical protein
MEIDGGRTRLVARPVDKVLWVPPHVDVIGNSLCLGATCKKLGKKLQAAVATSRATPETSGGQRTFPGTTDLAAVVVGREVWSVAADKPLQLAGAKKVGADKPVVTEVTVAGALLLVDWSACGVRCTTSIVYDSAGRALAPEVGGGGSLIELSAKHLVRVAEYAAVHVYDRATGKLLASLELDADPGGGDAVRLADDELAILFRPQGGNGSLLVRLNVVELDKKYSLKTKEKTFLPECTP